MTAIGWIVAVLGVILMRVGPLVALLYGIWVAVAEGSFSNGLWAFLGWSVACIVGGLLCVFSSIFMED